MDEKERFKNLNEWRFHYVISQFKDLVSEQNKHYVFNLILLCFLYYFIDKL